MKTTRITSIEKLNEYLEQILIRLAKIAESFREIERIFFSVSRDFQYLEIICSRLKKAKTVLPNPSILPKNAFHLSYIYDEKHKKWKLKKQDEKITEVIFQQRCNSLLAMNHTLMSEDQELVQMYWLRQLKFYQSRSNSKILLINEKKTEIKIKSLTTPIPLKNFLIQQLEIYKPLICLSPQATTKEICEKIISSESLTHRLCDGLILSMFVGRDISNNTQIIIKILPLINNFIHQLAVHLAIHFNLNLTLKKSLTRSNSMPAISIFKKIIPDSKMTPMFLTSDEVKLIENYRRDKLNKKQVIAGS